jgi:hypothetical protein
MRCCFVSERVQDIDYYECFYLQSASFDLEQQRAYSKLRFGKAEADVKGSPSVTQLMVCHGRR